MRTCVIWGKFSRTLAWAKIDTCISLSDEAPVFLADKHGLMMESVRFEPQRLTDQGCMPKTQEMFDHDKREESAILGRRLRRIC